MVIGSDIIYHPCIIPPLVNVLKHALIPKASKIGGKDSSKKEEEKEEDEEKGKSAPKPIAYISAAVRKPTTFDYFVLCLRNSR